MTGCSVLVELHLCNHPRVGPDDARRFYGMGKQWTKEPIDGRAKFVGVKVSDGTLADLDEIALAAGRTRSALIRDAIEQYIEGAAA